MFTKILIKNFKSCKSIVIDRVGPVVALVGRNGAGKSNILDAIHWGASSAVTNSRLDLEIRLDRGMPSFPGVEFELLADNLKFSYAIEIYSGPTPSLEEIIRLDKGGGWETFITRKSSEITIAEREAVYRIWPTIPCLLALNLLLPPGDHVISTISPLVSFLRRVRYYQFNEPLQDEDAQPFVPGTTYGRWLANLEAGDPGDSALLRILHMFVTDQDRFDELKSLIGPDGIELISDIEYDFVDAKKSRITDSKESNKNSSRFHLIRFNPQNTPGSPDHYFDFKHLSLGTRRIIRILTSLIADDRSVMLIEHPEDGIHPGLTRKLIGLLRDYADPMQLFIASHSSTVFNALSPEDIRFVEMIDGQTQLRGFTDTEMNAARRHLDEEGGIADVIQAIQE